MTEEVMKALMPIFASGVAIQQLNETLDPLTTWIAKVLRGDSNTKKVVFGVISVGFSLVVVAQCRLGILHALPIATKAPDWLDTLLTALIISTGTEGINSIVKFLGYAKEQKKASAANRKSAADGNLAAVNREILSTSSALDAPRPFVNLAANQMDLVTAGRICDACVRSAGNVHGSIRAQDPMEMFGIEDSDAIETFVNLIASDRKIGVPSAGFQIDPDALDVKKSTTFGELKQMVVNNSTPQT